MYGKERVQTQFLNRRISLTGCTDWATLYEDCSIYFRKETAEAPDIPKGRLIKKEAGCRRIVGDPTKPQLDNLWLTNKKENGENYEENYEQLRSRWIDG